MSDAEYNNMTPRQMEFAVFCVMCVAEELQKPATEIYDLMMQNRVLQDYIVEFYDVLHTQSREYIVEDIINLMKENGILVFDKSGKLLSCLRIKNPVVYLVTDSREENLYAVSYDIEEQHLYLSKLKTTL